MLQLQESLTPIQKETQIVVNETYTRELENKNIFQKEISTDTVLDIAN